MSSVPFFVFGLVDLTFRLSQYEENPDMRTPHEALDLLRMEQSTWALLQAVLP